MSRGRKPLMAIREAVLIARKRGETRAFMHEPDLICNFVIYCPGFVAHVRIKRVTRIHCDHAWIEGEAADALAALRAIADGTGISRELWVYLPRGAFRFFRVEKTGLVELARDGTPMVPKTWADVLARQEAARAAAQAAVPARPAEGEGTAADPAMAGPDASPQIPIPPAQAPPVELSSKNCSGQFFSSSGSDDPSHVGEDPLREGKGGI